MKQETKIIIRQIALSLVFLVLVFVTSPGLNIIFFALWLQNFMGSLWGIRIKRRKYMSIVTRNISRFLVVLLIVLTCYSIARRVLQGIVVSRGIIGWLNLWLWAAFALNEFLDDILKLIKWLHRRSKMKQEESMEIYLTYTYERKDLTLYTFLNYGSMFIIQFLLINNNSLSILFIFLWFATFIKRWLITKDLV